MLSIERAVPGAEPDGGRDLRESIEALDEAARSWLRASLPVRTVEIRGGTILFDDPSLDKPSGIRIEAVSGLVHRASFRRRTELRIKGQLPGAEGAAGSIQLRAEADRTLRARLRLEGVDLAILAPYAERLGIASSLGGSTGGTFSWQYQPGQPQSLVIRLAGSGLRASLLGSGEKIPFEVALERAALVARFEVSPSALRLQEAEISDGRVTLRWRRKPGASALETRRAATGRPAGGATSATNPRGARPPATGDPGVAGSAEPADGGGPAAGAQGRGAYHGGRLPRARREPHAGSSGRDHRASGARRRGAANRRGRQASRGAERQCDLERRRPGAPRRPRSARRAVTSRGSTPPCAVSRRSAPPTRSTASLPLPSSLAGIRGTAGLDPFAEPPVRRAHLAAAHGRCGVDSPPRPAVQHRARPRGDLARARWPRLRRPARGVGGHPDPGSGLLPPGARGEPPGRDEPGPSLRVHVARAGGGSLGEGPLGVRGHPPRPVEDPRCLGKLPDLREHAATGEVHTAPGSSRRGRGEPGGRPRQRRRAALPDRAPGAEDGPGGSHRVVRAREGAA